ncbi:M55 family metallopeptidase [Streptomyces sp. NPDC017413]|uniref:M55 family metallopeptidase n=1 Tax=unclassified Streptomyces TaxID=2593676 RepID=UPI00378A64A1
MKGLISVDMEGISGIVHSSETNPGRYDYQRGRELMTAEANAVIAGVLDAEPTAEVLVADAHGTFRNLLPERLDRRARLVRGKPRALNMLAGLDEGTDAALFVGYHVRAAIEPLTLAPAPLDVEVDLASPHAIDLATLVPGVSRAGGARTVTFTSPDCATAYRLVLLLAQLATIKPA